MLNLSKFATPTRGAKVPAVTHDARLAHEGEMIAQAIISGKANKGALWNAIKGAFAIGEKYGLTFEQVKAGLKGEATLAIRKALDGAEPETVADMEKKVNSMSVYFSTIDNACRRLTVTKDETGTKLVTAAKEDQAASPAELVAFKFAEIRNALKPDESVQREALAKILTRAAMKGDMEVITELAEIVGLKWNGDAWVNPLQSEVLTSMGSMEGIDDEETEGKREAA